MKSLAAIAIMCLLFSAFAYGVGWQGITIVAAWLILTAPAKDNYADKW